METLKFLMLDDRVVMVIYTSDDDLFDSIESGLNRNLVARSNHEWVDSANNIWELNHVPKAGGIYVLQVASPFR